MIFFKVLMIFLSLKVSPCLFKKMAKKNKNSNKVKEIFVLSENSVSKIILKLILRKNYFKNYSILKDQISNTT